MDMHQLVGNYTGIAFYDLMRKKDLKSETAGEEGKMDAVEEMAAGDNGLAEHDEAARNLSGFA